MAIYKTSEIAELLGVKPQTLNKQKDRGKVIIIDGQFDTENPINKIYLEKRELKQNPENKNNTHPKKKVVKTTKQELEETKIYASSEQKIKNANKKDEETTNFILKGERLKQQKIEQEIIAAKLKNEKELNKLISRDDVGLMLNSYLNRFIMNLQQQLNVLIRDSLNEVQADNIIIKNTCSKSINIINSCQDLALQEIEVGFKNIENARK